MTSFWNILKDQQKRMKNEADEKHTIQPNMSYCQQKQYILMILMAWLSLGCAWAGPGRGWLGWAWAEPWLAWLNRGWASLALSGLGWLCWAGLWLG